MRALRFVLLAAIAALVILPFSVTSARAQEFNRGISALLYYYNLSNGFDDWWGARFQGIDRKSEEFTAIYEFVYQQRGKGRAGIGQYYLYRDLKPRLYVFATGGIGIGENYFTRSKLYAELNWKILSRKNLVPVLGFGRNGYGSTWDFQTTLGATYYAHPFILQFRWFNFANVDQSIKNNSILARVDWLGFGPADVAIQYQNGGEGYRIQGSPDPNALQEFESQVLVIEGIGWFRRNQTGLKLRVEYATREDVYDRFGFEIGPNVNY